MFDIDRLLFSRLRVTGRGGGGGWSRGGGGGGLGSVLLAKIGDMEPCQFPLLTPVLYKCQVLYYNWKPASMAQWLNHRPMG